MAEAAGLALAGLRVVVPESRVLDLFSDMLARHGADVVRCPLVATCRLADASELDGWIGRLLAGHHHLLAFYTGEGVARIAERAEELGLLAAVVEQLERAPKVARGPKPVAALRKLGVTTRLAKAAEPTTDGLIATLAGLDVRGQVIGVQLYPGAPVERLDEVLGEMGAEFDPVLPYGYASDESDARVERVIRDMAAGGIDLIAFTSQLQVQRLLEVAERRAIRAELAQALAATTIAAVGPITERAVTEAGGTVRIQPPATFHMKPLVAQILQELGRPR